MLANTGEEVGLRAANIAAGNIYARGMARSSTGLIRSGRSQFLNLIQGAGLVRDPASHLAADVMNIENDVANQYSEVERDIIEQARLGKGGTAVSMGGEVLYDPHSRTKRNVEQALYAARRGRKTAMRNEIASMLVNQAELTSGEADMLAHGIADEEWRKGLKGADKTKYQELVAKLEDLVKTMAGQNKLGTGSLTGSGTNDMKKAVDNAVLQISNFAGALKEGKDYIETIARGK
jgi:hypothetical protein